MVIADEKLQMLSYFSFKVQFWKDKKSAQSIFFSRRMQQE